MSHMTQITSVHVLVGGGGGGGIMEKWGGACPGAAEGPQESRSGQQLQLKLLLCYD